jgi:hypothetical protein
LRRVENGSIYSNADMLGSSKGPSEAVGQISREKSRTILAVVTASVISLVVWGLVVALNVR